MCCPFFFLLSFVAVVQNLQVHTSPAYTAYLYLGLSAWRWVQPAHSWHLVLAMVPPIVNPAQYFMHDLWHLLVEITLNFRTILLLLCALLNT